MQCQFNTMRLLFSLFLLISLQAFGNDTTKLYHPYADVQKDVMAAVAKAKKENKHVLLQIGGNWCIWCYRFNDFVTTDSTLRTLLQENYVLYHLNYSKENKNLDYLKKLDYPQRFGFPALVVLDAHGNRLHTQDSGLLEKDKSYDFTKVKTFLINWAPSAFDEKKYKE